MARSIEHKALAPLKARFPDVKFFVGEFRDMVTVVVPREAIVPVCTFLRDDPKLRYDMLAERKGDIETVHRRRVTLGEVLGNGIAVREGLLLGDRVVVSGATLLVDGDAIRSIP